MTDKIKIEVIKEILEKIDFESIDADVDETELLKCYDALFEICEIAYQ